jgi:hypothetical protein
MRQSFRVSIDIKITINAALVAANRWAGQPLDSMMGRGRIIPASLYLHLIRRSVYRKLSELPIPQQL